MARVRKNVWSLDAHDETLTWYARAVSAMKERPIADPTSWRYQAAVHEYQRDGDPLSTPNDKLPTAADQTRFWTQCQHGSWYFLPWHRMYLHHFETIVAAEVEKLGGPAGWALPYWNYSASAHARLLPPAFRQPKLPDGTPNGLYVEQRDPRCNAGQPFAHARDTDVKACLEQRHFDSPSAGGSSSFGGPVTVFEHGGGAQGALEQTPHGSIHVAVGGDGGWMGAFNTAALDPILAASCKYRQALAGLARRQGRGALGPDDERLAALGPVRAARREGPGRDHGPGRRDRQHQAAALVFLRRRE